tara:strand:+ start:5181 stop:5696 length:516 start_codon:yes stop_codon:yes gene_type:complete
MGILSAASMIMIFISSVNGLTTPTIKNTQKVTKFVQEAELKHGRVAMASTLIIPTLELLNENNQGIYELSSQPLTFQLSLLGVFACSEVAQLLKAYEFPDTPEKWFNMKSEHVPGEYNFDPLKFSNTTEKLSMYKNAELFNGRLAMLSALGILVQELCTDKTVIDTVVNNF